MDRYPDVSVVSFMPKPADPAVAEWGQKLDLRETPVWPPRKKLFQAKPAGHLLWPLHPMNLDPDGRRAYVGGILRDGLDAQYRRGYSISFIDDATSSAGLMGLNPYLEEMLTNGRAGGAGAWLAAQKPAGTRTSAGVSTLVWGNATHLFYGLDPERHRHREVYGDLRAEPEAR